MTFVQLSVFKLYVLFIYDLVTRPLEWQNQTWLCTSFPFASYIGHAFDKFKNIKQSSQVYLVKTLMEPQLSTWKN